MMCIFACKVKFRVFSVSEECGGLRHGWANGGACFEVL